MRKGVKKSVSIIKCAYLICVYLIDMCGLTASPLTPLE